MRLRKFPFISNWLFLPWNGVGFCEMPFLYLLRWYVGFVFYFINIGYYINWYFNVVLTLHSWDKSTQSWHVFFICCWIWFFSLLLRNFPLIFIREIGLWLSFLKIPLVCVLGCHRSHRMNWEVSLLFNFWEEFLKCQC